MVRAKLSCHPQTKEFEWTILDDKDQPVLYIETPNHNLIVLRNYLLTNKADDTFGGSVNFVEGAQDPNKPDQKWNGSDLVQENQDWSRRHPLSVFIQLAPGTSITQTIYYYHPITQQEVQSKARKQSVIACLTAICTDILIYVLEYDEKQRRLAIEEHRLTRAQHAEEFAALGLSK